MVVVEDGRDHMGETITVAVSRVLQTVAGRMVFGIPAETRNGVELRRH
jgi:uncharacterized protein YacL